MMTPLSIKPSDQVRKAADTEASSSHALVNLTRLIRSLDNVDPEDRDASNGRILPAEIALRRDWEVRQWAARRHGKLKFNQTVQYARVLLDSLRVQNEQYVPRPPPQCGRKCKIVPSRSLKTSSTLSTLDQTLNNVEERYIGVLSSQLTTANGIGFGVQTPSLVLLPLSPPPAPVSAVTSHTASIPTPDSTPPFQTGDIPSNTVRHRSIPKDYLTARLREDVQRGEVGLLPLRTKTASEANARESLLGPPESAGGLGAAQLHEELGGQLADVRP